MGGYFGPDIIIATSVVNGHYGNNDFGRLQSIDPIHAPAQKIFRFPLHNHLAPTTTTAADFGLIRRWLHATHSQVIKIQMLIVHPLWTLLLHQQDQWPVPANVCHVIKINDNFQSGMNLFFSSWKQSGTLGSSWQLLATLEFAGSFWLCLALSFLKLLETF